MALAALSHESRCDAIVLEVGLGGRLDSTNVCTPSVSAITSIGLDHQHVLGNNLPDIAREKAGILKPGVPVVSGVTDRAACDVIADIAANRSAPLFQVDRDFHYRYEPLPQWGSRLEYTGHVAPLRERLLLTLEMEGEHQARNASVAISLIDLLRDQGVTIPDEAVVEGIGRMQCAGRIERLSLPHGVTAIVDAAHNQDSIAALCRCLQRRSSGQRIAVVFGTSIDKSAEEMLQSLSEQADELVLTRFFGNPRYVPPADLKPLVPHAKEAGSRVVEDPIEACRCALESVTPGGTLVVCGSFFLAAETRDWLASQADSV